MSLRVVARLALVCLLLISSGGLAGCLASADGLRPLDDEAMTAPDWKAGTKWVWQVETELGDGKGSPHVDRDRRTRTMEVLQTDTEVAWDRGNWVRLDEGYGRGPRTLFVDLETREWRGELRTRIGSEEFDPPAYVHLPPSPTWDLRFPMRGSDPIVVEREGPGDPFRSVASASGRETIETVIGPLETIRVDRETTGVHRIGDLDVHWVTIERLWYAPAVGAVVRSEGATDGAGGFVAPEGGPASMPPRQVLSWTMRLQSFADGDGVARQIGPHDASSTDLLLTQMAESEARVEARRTDPQRIGYQAPPALVLDVPEAAVNLSEAAQGLRFHLHEADDGTPGRAVAQPWPLQWSVTRDGADGLVERAAYNGTTFRFVPPAPDGYTITAVAQVPLVDGTRIEVTARSRVEVAWEANITHEQQRLQGQGNVTLVELLPSLRGNVLELTGFRFSGHDHLPDTGGLYVVNATAAVSIDQRAVHVFEDDAPHTLQWRYGGPDLVLTQAPVTTGHEIHVDLQVSGRSGGPSR